MNNVLTRLQALRDKASQLKQAVDSAPAKAALLRDAVNATTGQLQQLRADVQGTVASLKSDSDASLAETLVELNGGIGTLARAGYDLGGVDIEQGPTPRVIVHLDQIASARTTPLESLMKEVSGKRTLQAILNALIRAEALEEKVQLSDLSFRGLIVHIGAVPTVRLCWRRQHEDVEEEAHLFAQKMAPALKAEPLAQPAPPPLPNYGTSSFFDKPAAVVVAPEPAPAAPAPQPAPAVMARPVAIEIKQASLAPTPSYSTLRPSSSSPKAAPAEADPSTGDWRKDALARFKRMPHLGR